MYTLPSPGQPTAKSSMPSPLTSPSGAAEVPHWAPLVESGLNDVLRIGEPPHIITTYPEPFDGAPTSKSSAPSPSTSPTFTVMLPSPIWLEFALHSPMLVWVFEPVGFV